MSDDRMIATRVDGRSRGNLDAGLSLGYGIRLYLPLDKGALEVAGPIVEHWCRNWIGKDFTPLMEPVEWFWEAHCPGIHLRAHPPAAALVTLYQLARSRHTRPHAVTHLFVCQRLLWQEEWRRRFEKEMNLWLISNTGIDWPRHLFEPLIVGISFPMRNSNHRPWLVRQKREEVVESGRALTQLSKACHLSIRNYLRKLWAHPWDLPPVPRSVVR